MKDGLGIRTVPIADTLVPVFFRPAQNRPPDILGSVALSFFQKIRLVFRIWSRRRGEAALDRRRAFLERETSWGKVSAPQEAVSTSRRSSRYDIEGLQIAWLDDSGRFAYFLDRDSGDVTECPFDSENLARFESEPRWVRVPIRTESSDNLDRQAFIETLEPPVSASLLAAAATPSEFREAIARDRAIERSWYNFKNERILSAIEGWLKTTTD